MYLLCYCKPVPLSAANFHCSLVMPDLQDCMTPCDKGSLALTDESLIVAVIAENAGKHLYAIRSCWSLTGNFSQDVEQCSCRHVVWLISYFFIVETNGQWSAILWMCVFTHLYWCWMKFVSEMLCLLYLFAYLIHEIHKKNFFFHKNNSTFYFLLISSLVDVILHVHWCLYMCCHFA